MSFVYFLPIIYFISFRVLIHIFQFTVKHTNTSSFSICFLKFDSHQMKFNSIQSQFSFARRPSMGYCNVFPHLTLWSIWNRKFSQLLPLGAIVNSSLKNSSNCLIITKQFDKMVETLKSIELPLLILCFQKVYNFSVYSKA